MERKDDDEADRVRRRRSQVRSVNDNNPSPRKSLPQAMVARLTHQSPRTVRRKLQLGIYKPVWRGGRRFVLADSIDDLNQSQPLQPPPRRPLRPHWK